MLNLQVVFKVQPLQLTAPQPVKDFVVAHCLFCLRKRFSPFISLLLLSMWHTMICMLSADCKLPTPLGGLLTFLVDLIDKPRTTCSPGAVDAPSAERGYQPKTGEAAARTVAAGPQAEAPGCNFAANEGLQYSSQQLYCTDSSWSGGESGALGAKCRLARTAALFCVKTRGGLLLASHRVASSGSAATLLLIHSCPARAA